VASEAGYVILDQFQLGQELHPVFGMPVMRCCMDEQTLVRVLPQVREYHLQSAEANHSYNVLFAFNAQHDCGATECCMTGVRTRRQEREDSGQITKFIQHSALQQFILNTTQLHHAHLIAEYLPPHLIAAPQWISDRQQEFRATLIRPL
jgi:hypothetical protein